MPLEIAGPNIGDAAPEFSLPEATGDRLSLGGLRGTRVLLVFYRGAW